MTGLYAHLHESTVLLAEADNETRIQAILKGVWVNYTRAKEIIGQMEELFKHPPINRMPDILISGPSNNGKTEILRRFLSKHPPNPNPGGDRSIIPVLMVSAPPTPDFGELCARMLIELNAPFREAAKPTERMRAVSLVMKQTQTRMLLIDEIQHMLSGGATKQREFRNAIKDLANGLQLSIVAAGVEEASTVFATDPQLSNRFNPEPLPLWKLDTEFGRLLTSIERKLPLRKPSNLKSPELMQQIAFMSEGLIGEVYGVLKKAAVEAIRNGSEQISLKLLSEIRWKPPSARKERPRIG